MSLLEYASAANDFIQWPLAQDTIQIIENTGQTRFDAIRYEIDHPTKPEVPQQVPIINQGGDHVGEVKHSYQDPAFREACRAALEAKEAEALGSLAITHAE
ncbi:MAG: hypothetical protein M3Q14_03490 [bacterium]|nr:hypothetical protein [bacterium]